ncbi:hypothetical protein COB72_05370 [bacterium]|nr:MAG: hypothetical protein COB72_05370 [bacterium]
MSAWTYEDIRIAIDGAWVIEPKADAIEFAGVAIDTRELSRGQVFFAFAGEQVDGHEYLRPACEAGASVCVVSDVCKVASDLGVPVLVVDDALEAITKLARAWRKQLKATVIAITGSNGKTTTCRMVDAVCAQSGSSYCSQRSFNNALGVPITILNTPIDAKYLVAELGTSSPSEIAARAELIDPDIAVITSIGSAHLEELGDRAGVAREKASIIHALSPGASAVVIGGVNELDAVIEGKEQELNVIRVNSDRVRVVETDTGFTAFELDGVAFAIPMLGTHNAMNAAMAIEVGRLIGLDDDSIRIGLKNIEQPKMRFERVEISTPTEPIVIYNDAYNANPDSMRAALATFDSLQTKSPKLAILGDMLELGGHSKTQHQSLVEELARYSSVRRVVLVGKLFSQTERDAKQVEIVKAADDEAMNTIASMIKPGSCVLLKGSRGIKLERIVDALREHHHTRPDSYPKAHTSA